MAVRRQASSVFIVSVASLTVTFLLFHHGDKAADVFQSLTKQWGRPCATDWKAFDFSAANQQDVLEYFYWSDQASCLLPHDFGGQMMEEPRGIDGQKAVCLDPLVAPHKDRCLVYSFGVNQDWTFEDTMELYGCQVFAFDPSINLPDHNRSSSIRFYRSGLGHKDFVNDKGWVINRLETLYDRLNHRGRLIDYLKIDIEFDEWRTLPEILSSGMLKRVRQLGVEVHLFNFTTLDGYRSAARTLQSLEEAGMVRFDSKYNPWYYKRDWTLNDYNGSLCFELAWFQNIIG